MYADRARQIKNKPIVNVDPATLELAKLRKQVLVLKAQLAKYKHMMGNGQYNSFPSDHQEVLLHSI
jgi:kinesin family protein 4/21/27